VKRIVFIPILLVSTVISYFIFRSLPEFIRNGGPLIVMLMVLSILSVTFIVERLWTLHKAEGKGALPAFLRNLKNSVHGGQINDAIETCRKRGGCMGNVLGAGLEFYEMRRSAYDTHDKLIDETKKAIEDANALETPLLERNLIALSTIASIATMVGLLGTTIGMIRSFKAMSHAGAPDAIALALGISEALINTAGGLFIAILSIVMYNYFTNRVDAFNYSLDETTHQVLTLLEHQGASK
jgi:biopolymer transport protein ExbB